MPISEEKYLRWIDNQFVPILDLFYGVVNSLVGKKTDDPRQPFSQTLAFKLAFHALSIYYLSKGTYVKLPYIDTYFFDFASIAVLTRAALESYLTWFEIFFEPNTDDDFEFLFLAWRLTGLVTAEGVEPYDKTQAELIATIDNLLSEFRQKIKTTERFQKLDKKKQKDILNGKRVLNSKEVAARAGFGGKHFRRLFTYLSGYVHSDGLSSTQVFSAKTENEQLDYIKSDLRLITAIISKMIVGYYYKYPEAKQFCDRNSEIYALAFRLSKVLFKKMEDSSIQPG